MAQSIELFIPGEPLAKQRPQFNSVTKTAYTPNQTLNYESYVRWFLYSKFDSEGKPVFFKPDEPLFLFTTAYHKLPKGKWKEWERNFGMVYKTSKPDFDNLAKIIADALNGIVFTDDAQIIGGLPFKKYAAPGELPGVRLRLVSWFAVADGLQDYIL